MLKEVVVSMIAWINTQGVLPPPDDTLNIDNLTIEIVSTYEMAKSLERCLVISMEERLPFEVYYELAPRLRGLYCNDRISIAKRILDNYGIESVEFNEVLVHETVHYIQDYNGQMENESLHGPNGCVKHYERDAYIIANKFYESVGLEVQYSEVEINFMSSCGDE